jgi:PAS domain S-box-containing protein
MAAGNRFDDGLRTLLDVSSDAVFLTTIDGRILHANPRGCQLLGYTLAEVTKLTRLDVVLDDERFRAAAGVRASAGGHRANLTLVRKGGERFDAEVTAAEFRQRDDEGRVWILVHELSERQRADEATRALRESEETFRALAEASLEGIFLQCDGRILLANAAVERMHGAPRGGLVGRSMLDFVAPEVREDILRRATARSEEPYETIGLRLDGTTFPAEVHPRTGPMDFRGSPTRVIAVRDLSARKQLEEKLALADRMTSLGTLAAGVAHEINNPLAAVTLSLELARSELARSPDASTSRVAELLATAEENAQRVRRIVRDLRAFARPAEEPLAPVDLAEVIAYAQNVAHHEVRHRARVEVTIGPVGEIYGSRARLEQVMLNLLVNAAQALPDDGAEHRIDIDVRAQGEQRIEIVVRDTGVGIPPELRPRLFDPFVTTKPIGVGTGLGLSICHTIVTSLGGTIDVESEVGKGTTFRVVLPRGSAPPQLRARAEPKRVRPNERGRILLIDDERHIRDVLVQLLDAHDVVTVGDVPAALALLCRGDAFDVILCDVMMPGMTGADFHDEVERRWPELLERIVFVTGGAVTPRARELLERASNAPLEKPFSADELDLRIAALLPRA